MTRDPVLGVTDVNGMCVLALFPNAIGEVTANFCGDGIARHTAYTFIVRHPTTGLIILSTVATLPNADCQLTDVAGNVCPPTETLVPLPIVTPAFGVLNGVIDPTQKPYLCKGDYNADDGPGMEQAIQDAIAQRKKLLIPAGRYIIRPNSLTGGRLFANGDTFWMEGLGDVHFYSGGDGQLVFEHQPLSPNQYNLCVVRGIRVSNVDDFNVNGARRYKGVTGMKFTQTVGAQVDNVDVLGCHLGAWLQAAQHCSWRGLRPMWGIIDSQVEISKDSVGLLLEQTALAGGGNNHDFSYFNGSYNDVGAMIRASSAFPLHSNVFTNPVILGCPVCGIYANKVQNVRFAEGSPELCGNYTQAVYGPLPRTLASSQAYTLATGEVKVIQGENVKRSNIYIKNDASVFLDDFFSVSSETVQQIILESNSTLYTDGLTSNYGGLSIDDTSTVVPAGQWAVYDSQIQARLPFVHSFEDTRLQGRTNFHAFPARSVVPAFPNGAGTDPIGTIFPYLTWGIETYPQVYNGMEYVRSQSRMLPFTQFPAEVGATGLKRSGFDLVLPTDPALVGGNIPAATAFYFAATFLATVDTELTLNLCQSTGGGLIDLKAGIPKRVLYKGTSLGVAVTPSVEFYPNDANGAKVYVFDIAGRVAYPRSEILSIAHHAQVNPMQAPELLQPFEVQGDADANIDISSAPHQIITDAITADRTLSIVVANADIGAGRRYRFTRLPSSTGDFSVFVKPPGVNPIAALQPGDWVEVTSNKSFFAIPRAFDWTVVARGRAIPPLYGPLTINVGNPSPDFTVDANDGVELAYYGLTFNRNAVVTLTGIRRSTYANSGGGYRPLRVVRNPNAGGAYTLTMKQGGVTLAILTGAAQYADFACLPSGWYLLGYGRLDQAFFQDPLTVKPGDADTNVYSLPAEVIIFDTPITADRNAIFNTVGGSVNMPAAQGKTYRVVRTANATGAFNVVVKLQSGTVLKNLGVSTWADVATDGATWYLVGYGAL